MVTKLENVQVTSVGEPETHDAVLGLDESGKGGKVGGRSRAGELWARDEQRSREGRDAGGAH